MKENEMEILSAKKKWSSVTLQFWLIDSSYLEYWNIIFFLHTHWN